MVVFAFLRYLLFNPAPWPSIIASTGTSLVGSSGLRLASLASAPTARPSRRVAGFSLLELIVVVAIVGLLATLAAPELGKVRQRAESTACVANLRAIGVAARLFIADNDGLYPIIEPNPAEPIYEEEIEAKGLLETLEPYGITLRTLRCPTDVSFHNYFQERGTSYHWRPIADDESGMAPIIYTRRGARNVNPRRVRICTDFEPIHGGRMNVLRGHGDVERVR